MVGRKSKTVEYYAWQNMRSRCNNPGATGYENYGGRGIAVCERWDDFARFFADMGLRPGPLYSLDRIDNNAGYSPENCRWATKREQQRNKRGHKLTPADVVEIREMSRLGQSYEGIARHFGVSSVLVSKTVRRLCWASVA